MQTFELEARNNSDFTFVRNASAFAALYDLNTATLRAQLRRPGAGQDVAFEFSSSNGRITFDGVSKHITMGAKAADIAHLTGTYNWDIRVEVGTVIRDVIYGGTVIFIDGATR